MNRKMRILTAATILALAPLAIAQTGATAANGEIETQVRSFDTTAANKGQTQVAEKIAAFFANLAGSKENAVALVTALRNGTAVNLTAPATGTGTGTGTTTTFTPPTGKMGWGNVKIALGLAQDALLRAGITKPTAAQLQTALMGGTITRADGTKVTLDGVLKMRADGMGWGQIAHKGGTNVGPVVSSLKETQAQLAKLPTTGTGTAATATTTKGVTTAAGSSSAAAGKGPSKGITTATGATATASGVVTAEGGSSAAHQPKGNAYGRGIVTATGTSASTSIAATGGGKPTTAGTGVVNAAGGNASSVTTGQGNAGGNEGKGQGKGKGG